VKNGDAAADLPQMFHLFFSTCHSQKKKSFLSNFVVCQYFSIFSSGGQLWRWFIYYSRECFLRRFAIKWKMLQTLCSGVENLLQTIFCELSLFMAFFSPLLRFSMINFHIYLFCIFATSGGLMKSFVIEKV
jgi:hypothetical protein